VAPDDAPATRDAVAPDDAERPAGPEGEPEDPMAAEDPSADGPQSAGAPASDPDLAADPDEPVDARAVQRGDEAGTAAESGPSRPGVPPAASAATTNEMPSAGDPAEGDRATTSGSWRPDILDADNQTRVLDLETGAVEPDARTISRREPRSAPPHTGEAPTGEDHNPLPQPQPPPEGSL
jgi:hypothetical protein